MSWVRHRSLTTALVISLALLCLLITLLALVCIQLLSSIATAYLCGICADVTSTSSGMSQEMTVRGRVLLLVTDADMKSVPSLAHGTAYTVTAEQEVVNAFSPPRRATVRHTGAHVKVYIEVPTASNPFKALKSNGKMTGYTASELIFAA
jgi:hypothetical protein